MHYACSWVATHLQATALSNVVNDKGSVIYSKSLAWFLLNFFFIQLEQVKFEWSFLRSCSHLFAKVILKTLVKLIHNAGRIKQVFYIFTSEPKLTDAHASPEFFEYDYCSIALKVQQYFDS